MGAGKSKAAKEAAKQAAREPAPDVPDREFIKAIHRAGTINVTTASGRPPEPVAEAALRRSQIKPLPKRREAGAVAEEPRTHVSMSEWFDSIVLGKVPDGLTETQVALLRQYHQRLRKD